MSGHLLSILASALLVEHVTTFLPPFRDLSHLVGGIFTGLTGVPMSDQISGMLLISALLIGIWGIAFHFVHT